MLRALNIVLLLLLLLVYGVLCYYAPHRLSFVVTSGPAYEFTDAQQFIGIYRSGTCMAGTGPKFYFDSREIEFLCES